MRAWLCALFVMGVATKLGCPPSASACELSDPTPYTIVASERALDMAPPQAPTLKDVHIQRGTSGGCHGDSCDDTGTVTLRLESRDDRTPKSNIGYRIALAAGTPPSGFNFPVTPLVAPDGVVTLYFWDRGDGDLTFTLHVHAVDRAGNESLPTAVAVDDGDGLGCRAGRARSAPWAWLAGLLGAVLAHRMKGQSRRKPSTS